MRSKGTRITCVAGESCVTFSIFDHVNDTFYLLLVVVGISLDLVLSVIYVVAFLPPGLWGESAWLKWVSCVS